MKGIIFRQLEEFVVAHHGLVAWDNAITQCELPSNGVYIGTKTYDDSELSTLVGHFSDALNVPAQDIIRAFGLFIFDSLYDMAPEQAKQEKDLKSFLSLVDSLIHIEVKKLHADASLPSFATEGMEQGIMMEYRSPRKLCALSEGLILGAAKKFNTKVTISQPKCMHDGDDCCQLEVRFV
jgi:hypothetical protein